MGMARGQGQAPRQKVWKCRFGTEVGGASSRCSSGDAGPDRQFWGGVAEWLKLDALEGQQGAGEVEVKILLTAGTGDAQADAAKAADSARWFVDEQEQEKGEPNVLHVAVVRARGLKAADKSLMGTSSSDPFVTLQFGDKKKDRGS